MCGILTLIPTPIDDDGILDSHATATLMEAANSPIGTVVVEEARPARRRWLKWGLPRETIEHFINYNEHNRDQLNLELIQLLKDGKNLYLMSDGGLPAFCDPGKDLVDLCHKEKIKITATPFFNSIALAVALSGLNHDKFMFEGFLPKEKEKRINCLQNALNQNYTTVLMDTPYRLKQTLEQLLVAAGTKYKNRMVFLAMDLNSKSEELFRAPIHVVAKSSKAFGKREFILLISPTQI